MINRNQSEDQRCETRPRTNISNIATSSRGPVLVTVICLIGLAAILALRHNPSKSRQQGGTDSAQTNTQALLATSSLENFTGSSLGLHRGDHLAYRFHQQRSMNLHGGGGFAGLASPGATNQSVNIIMAQDGAFVLRVYDEKDSGWLIGFSLENAAVHTRIGNTLAPPDGSEADLRDEILAFVEKGGRIGRMSAETQTAPETLNHWRDILSRWQTVLATNSVVRRWNETEEDATGMYLAVYSRDRHQLPAVVHKQKQQYISLGGTTSKGLETRSKVAGNASIELNPYPVRIEGDEQFTLSAPEIGGGLNCLAHYSFLLLSATNSPEVKQTGSEMVRRFESRATSFSWAPSNDESKRALPSVDVAGTTIQQQLDELEQVLSAGMNGTPAEVRILEKIVALIRKDDAAVEVIADRLSRPEPLKNEPLCSALVGMLGAAGTPKAQETLIGIVNTDDWPSKQREMAIFSFAQVTEPIAESDDWLCQLHQKKNELSNSSLLILGAMGDRVREQNPDRFQSISQYVIGAASASNLDLNDQVAALDAIGNLGPQEVPEVIRNNLASDDPLLREKALQSLKRVQDAGAGALLSNTLQTDSAESVRMAAATLLADTRWTGGFDDLSRAATADTSEHVRMAALKSLADWLDTHPEGSRTIEQIAHQDLSADVREAAAQILANHCHLAGR
jgi:HEAT repeat protein